MKLFRLALCLLLTVLPVAAQGTYCPSTANVAVTVGTTGTAIAATDRDVAICGFLLAGTVAGTRIQIKSGSTNISPNYVTAANGNISYVQSTPIWVVPKGTAVTVTAGTGDVVGHINFGLIN